MCPAPGVAGVNLVAPAFTEQFETQIATVSTAFAQARAIRCLPVVRLEGARQGVQSRNAAWARPGVGAQADAPAGGGRRTRGTDRAGQAGGCQRLPIFDNSTPLDGIAPDCRKKSQTHETPLFIAVFIAF